MPGPALTTALDALILTLDVCCAVDACGSTSRLRQWAESAAPAQPGLMMIGGLIRQGQLE